MKLTTQLLAAFIGGQFEVQNKNEKYLYRGEIKTAEVLDDGEVLAITFNWKAKGEGFPPIPTGWVNESDLTYRVDLVLYNVSDIGPSREGGDNRLCIQSGVIGELGVFYPPNGSKLDPAKVKGLELSAAQ